jgi:hypothetical protein
MLHLLWGELAHLYSANFGAKLSASLRATCGWRPPFQPLLNESDELEQVGIGPRWDSGVKSFAVESRPLFETT